MTTRTRPDKNGTAPRLKVQAPAPDEESEVLEVPTQLVRLDRLLSSQTNPRKHFDEAALAELAESIRTKGVLQPILCRPAPGFRLAPRVGASKGKWAWENDRLHFSWFDSEAEAKASPPLEIVAGERRFRAAKLAGCNSIPAIVRDLDDRAALEVQIVENEQRADTTALEKALGYAALLKHHGYTVEGLAAKVGKSPSTVRNLLKLQQLPALAHEALEAGQLQASTAELIARVPGEQTRDEVVRRVLANYRYGGSAPDEDEVRQALAAGDCVSMSYRETKEMIEASYMLELKKASFSRKSLDLLPPAGSCDACPKRTGNNPEEYPGSRADVCTDPECFRAKSKAHHDRILEAAKESGKTILPEKKSKKLFNDYDPHSLDYSAPYVDLAGTCHDVPGNEGWKKLVGKQLAGQVVVAVDPEGGVHELVPKAAAMKVLREEHGATARDASDTKWEAERKQQEARQRREHEARKAAALAAGEEAAKVMLAASAGVEWPGRLTMLLRALAMILPEVLWTDACRRVRQRRNLPKGDDRAIIRAEANNLPGAPELFALVAELVGSRLLESFTATYSTGHQGPEQRAFWEAFGVDLGKLRKEAEAANKARSKSKRRAADLIEGRA